jgi:hypothetical protein
MEKWKFCVIVLVTNFAGAFGQGCIKESGNSLELKDCGTEDLKFDESVINLDNIKTITAIDNNFPSLSGEFFGKFQNLEKLILMQCKISEISVDAFQGLTKLKKLYLDENEIKKLNESVFESLENLEVLYLDANQIEDLDKNLLKYNQNLNVLNGTLSSI